MVQRKERMEVRDASVECWMCEFVSGDGDELQEEREKLVGSLIDANYKLKRAEY